MTTNFKHHVSRHLESFRLKKSIPEYFFEVSWEVCNKVGGINTVLVSKAARMKQYYGDQYFLVGPYFSAEQFDREVTKEAPPRKLAHVIEALAKEGLTAHYGRWNVKGSPAVILIDFQAWWPRINDVKARLWEWYQIDSLGSYRDYEEPVLWSWTVGVFLAACAQAFSPRSVVGQFHEWLSGAGLLYLRRKKIPMGLVFTTHATALGRALASNGVDIYHPETIGDLNQASYRFGVASKHQLERAVALAAHVFTTVSAITGEEAKRFLGRSPDYLLLNGLDIATFPTHSRQLLLHESEKQAMRDFAAYTFFPFYRFDLENTLFYYLASRYEFHDKGIDVFIESLGLLNRSLQAAKSKKTVVAFFWVPAGTNGPSPELLRHREMYFKLLARLKEEHLGWGAREIGEFMDHPRPKMLAQLHATTLELLWKFFHPEHEIPLSTHLLSDPHDAILEAFRRHGLLNRAEDRVKVIFYPVYLTPKDGFLNLGYTKSLQAGHLGVYPSYYEPWGYTPLESAALGVSSVTTDLAGFGRYLVTEGHHSPKKQFPGIFVLPRTDAKVAPAVFLAGILHRFTFWSRSNRHKNAGEARRLSELADWKFFVIHYLKAHAHALRALKKR